MLCSNVYAAVDFNGGDADDAIDISGTNIHGANFTLSCWVKRETDTGGNEFIMNADGANGDPDERDWQFRVNASDQLQCIHFVSTSNASTNTTATLTVGTWYHVACTYDTTTLRTYLNGVADGTDGSLTGNNNTDGACVTVGNRNNVVDCVTEDFSGDFVGKISECAIWTNDLTAAEVALLAKSRVKRMPLQIQPSSLGAYWPLDDVGDGVEAEGLTFVDMSGNGHTGTGNAGADGTDILGAAEEVLSYQ